MNLNLDAAEARLGKISNNTPKVGDERVSIFTLPLAEIVLTEQQLNELLGEHTDRAWFNTGRDKLKTPMPWTQHCEHGVLIEGEFHIPDLVIGVSSGDLQFETEVEGDVETPAGKVTKLRLKPQPGGITHLSCSVQVRPGLGKKNLQLQEHQHRAVRITCGELIRVQPAQRDAFDPDEEGADADAGEVQAAAFNNTSGKPIDGTTAESRARSRSSRKEAH